MRNLVVSFVDVGQGDCTTVVDANGIGMLIDCPSRRDRVAVEELEAQGCTSLRVAIVSHSDEDHAGGVLDVLERMAERFDGRIYFNVDSLMAAPIIVTDIEQQKIEGRKRRAFLGRVREYGPRVAVAHENDPQRLGMVRWQILAPQYWEVVEAWWTRNPNRASAIVVITAFDQSVVVGGDAQLVTWERISNVLPNHATVRWPHHGGSLAGGKNASSAQKRLFEISKPRRVIVSVGSGNSRGHPTDDFFDARHSFGSELLCTEASNKCVKGGGTGGVCAGTIRLTWTADNEELTTSPPDHAERVGTFGAGRCDLAMLISSTPDPREEGE